MPANAAIIGRVAVKVLPDTNDFRKETQRKLDAIEKQLEISVPTRADLTGAKRDLLEEVRKLNQENRNMDSRKVRLYTTLSSDNIRQELRKVIRRYQTLAQTEKVKIDTELRASDLTVKTDLDKDSLKRTKEQLDHWVRKISPLKIPVEINYSSSRAFVAERRLDVLTRPREVELLPKVNSAAAASVIATLAALSGGRVLNDMFGEFKNFIKNLDKSVPLLASMALALGTLTSFGLTAASNLAALSSSLAQIGPAVLAMPGLFGGMAIGVGVTIAALKDFNKVFPDVKATMSAMQDLISTNFWSQAQAPFRVMIDQILPQFTAGFGVAATALGGFFGSLAGSLTHSFDGVIASMFQNLATSIQIASTATDGMANTITILGQVGASYLPQLAQWFVGVVNQFDNFVAKAAADGRLKGWIDQGIYLLGQLGQVAVNTGKILGGIGSAALSAGGSGLASLAATLGTVARVVNSPAFQNQLVATLQAAHAAISAIAAQAGPALNDMFSTLASTLTTILPIIGNTVGVAVKAVATVLASPAVQSGIQALFQGISSGIAALAPAFATLGPVIGSLGSLIGTFASAFGPVLAQAVNMLVPIFQALVPAIEPLITVLSGSLAGILKALVPAVTAIAKAFGAMVAPLAGALQPVITAMTPIFAQLGQILGEVATAILPPLGAAFAQLMPALAPLIVALGQLVIAILKPLLPLLATLIATALPPLATAISAVATAIVPFIQALTSIVNFIMPVLVPALTFLVNMFTGAIIGAINGVATVLNGALTFIMGIWNTFAGLFTGNFTQMWDGIKGIFSGAWELIKGIIEVALNVGVLGILRKGFAVFKAMFTELGPALKAIWDALWNGLKTSVTGIWETIRVGFSLWLDALKRSPQAALDALKALFRAVWDDITTIFKTAWENSGKKVTEGIANVIGYVKELPGKASSALSNIGSTLYNAGMSLIQGFIDGIAGMFGAVKGKLGDLTSKLTSWKGPETLDRVLLYNAGQLVIGGFINGLESKYDAVRKSLAGLTADVEGTSIGSPSAQLGGYSSAGIANGLLLSSAATTQPQKVLNYYAAPGSSISSEEDLFAAASRPRFGW